MEWFGPGNGFDAITPLGPAYCLGVVWDSEDPEWICRMDRTGEVFNFGNTEFRVASSITNGYPNVSRFENLNDKTLRQVARYRLNGWLRA